MFCIDIVSWRKAATSPCFALSSPCMKKGYRGPITCIDIVCEGCKGPMVVVVVAALSSLARIWGECLTIHSSPALFF